jgi:hypothetical protein
MNVEPLVKSGLDYWNRKRGGRGMPAQRDIDPSEITSLLPNIQLVDIVGDRVRYRLVGTALVDAYGENWTGRYVDEIFTDDRLAFVTQVYQTMRIERRPIIVKNMFLSKAGVYIESNRVNLPLSEDGSSLSQVLTVATIEFLGAATSEPLTSDKQPLPHFGTVKVIDPTSL